MHAGVSRVLESVRRPEYTGENRCLPCTVVNTTIAAGGSVAVGIALDPLAGLALFGGSLAAIGLRGYLVPGTPTLTKRYLPDRMHRVFGTHLEHRTETTSDEPDLEGVLHDLELVQPCRERDDLCLEPTVEQTWYAFTKTLEDPKSQVARLASRLELDPEGVTIAEHESAVGVQFEGQTLGTWPSRAALIADLALTPVLDEHAPTWQTLEDDQQGMVLTALRAFLEECPACGGVVEGSEKTVESCCSTHTAQNVQCTDCDQALLRDVYV